MTDEEIINPIFDARRVYKKRIKEDTVKDLKTIDIIDAKIDYYLELEKTKGKDYFNNILTLIQTKNKIYDRVHKRLYPTAW